MSEYGGLVDKEKKTDGISEFERSENVVNDMLSKMTDIESVSNFETSKIESSGDIKNYSFTQERDEPEVDIYGREYLKTESDHTYYSPQNIQLVQKMGYLVCHIYFEDNKGRTGVHLNWFNEADHSKYGAAGRVIDFKIYNNGKLVGTDRHDRDSLICNGVYSGNNGIEMYNNKGERTGESEFRVPPISGQDEAGWHHDLNYELLGVEGFDPVRNGWTTLRADEKFIAANIEVVNDSKESEETRLKANDALTLFKGAILKKQKEIALWYAQQKELSTFLSEEDYLELKDYNINRADKTRVVKNFIEVVKSKSVEEEDKVLEQNISKLETLMILSKIHIEVVGLILLRHPTAKRIANVQTSSSDDLLDVLRLIASKIVISAPTFNEKACLKEFREIYFERKSYKVEMWDGTVKTSNPWLPKEGCWDDKKGVLGRPLSPMFLPI